MHGHARGALHQGFNNQRCSASVMLPQPMFQSTGCTAGYIGGVFTGLRRAGIGAGHRGGKPHQRCISLPKNGHVSHGQCSHGFAVVTACHTYKMTFFREADVAPVMGAHLQRDFSCRRTVAGIKSVAKAGQMPKLFRQLDHRLVGKSGQHHMVKLVELRRERGLDMRVAVTKQVNPP